MEAVAHRSPARALIVSIHDVAPATQAETAQILSELAKIGVQACSLLVVPNYHRRGDSLADAAFRGWLACMQATGHEVVLHGFFHQRAARPRESLLAKLTTRFYTAGEGEFYDLGYDEAYRLVTAAREQFGRHDFHPAGFIAPAWLLSAEAERAVADAGFRYTTRLGSVLDLRSRAEFRSQSLVWSVRSRWRRGVSLAWNRALFARLQRNPLLRLGVHPPDCRHPKIWRQILDLTAAALTDRDPITYRDWVASADSRAKISTPCLP